MDSKGVPVFWLEPTTTESGRATVNIKRSTLTPSPAFQGWITELRGGRNVVPELPKYTFGLNVGKEYSSYFPNGVRTVAGGDVTYNFATPLNFFGTPFNLSAGGGIIGSTVYTRIAVSGGKR